MKKIIAYAWSWTVMTALCFILLSGIELAVTFSLLFLAWEWVQFDTFVVLSFIRLNLLLSAIIGIAFAFSKENKPFIDGVANGTDTTDR